MLSSFSISHFNSNIQWRVLLFCCAVGWRFGVKASGWSQAGWSYCSSPGSASRASFAVGSWLPWSSWDCLVRVSLYSNEYLISCFLCTCVRMISIQIDSITSRARIKWDYNHYTVAWFYCFCLQLNEFQYVNTADFMWGQCIHPVIT